MIKFEKLPADIEGRLPQLAELLGQDENVVFAYLFGGLAKGKMKPLSDIDIALYLNSTNDLAEVKLTLFQRVSELLATAEIDLVILNTAPISLAGRILQKKQLIVDKEPFRRHLYESRTLREFFDFHHKEEELFRLRYGIGR
jgi:predicted nucleotidyltransferase